MFRPETFNMPARVLAASLLFSGSSCDFNRGSSPEESSKQATPIVLMRSSRQALSTVAVISRQRRVNSTSTPEVLTENDVLGDMYDSPLGYTLRPIRGVTAFKRTEESEIFCDSKTEASLGIIVSKLKTYDTYPTYAYNRRNFLKLNRRDVRQADIIFGHDYGRVLVYDKIEADQWSYFYMGGEVPPRALLQELLLGLVHADVQKVYEMFGKNRNGMYWHLQLIANTSAIREKYKTEERFTEVVKMMLKTFGSP